MMATAAGIGLATAVVSPLANFGLQELKSKIEKCTSLADIQKDLNDVLQWLLALQRDKDNEVRSDIIQKDPSEVYKLWKERVSYIEETVTSLNEEYEAAKKKKWHLVKNFGLKKKIKKALKDVIKVLEDCPKEILVDKPKRVKKEIGVPSIEEYPTLKKALQEIQNLLQSNGVKCVALHGEKGVGKTTIMQNLNNHFYDGVDNSFDMVIFIKVAADEQTDLHILQKIADRTKVDREGNEFEVAGRIQRVLEHKRYLLILDGVRHPPDGIWEKLDISEDRKDSKVVITTHYPLALKSKCVDRKVELKTLSPDDAWKMFQNIVGDNHLPDKGIARLVCKRFCCCLPLLIDPIARSFKYQESPTDWRRALDEWPRTQFEVDGLKEVYSLLEICYQLLGDQSRQKCFLYASLYPANSKIYTDYLVECCIVQGFLGATTKYNVMRGDMDLILKHLVNVAILEEGEQMRYVKMNDLYRQLALYISSKDSNSEFRIYVDYEEHEEAFRSKSWQNARWVSMIGSKRDSLPTNPNCGNLRTLMLQKSLNLVQISPTSFDSMGNLLVLNLYGTRIKELPSLSGLTKLKAVYLNGCSDLKIIPSQIQQLQHLEVFDIRDTGVNFLPRLEGLRCLRTSYVASGNYHEISELHKLEELTIEVKSLSQLGNDAENIIQKVASLENLTTFRCSFPSPKTLEVFLETSKSWRGKKQLTSFQFFVGCENSKHSKLIESFDDRIFKYVKYCNGEENDDLAITKMLPQAEAFELIRHNSLGTLLELGNTSNLEYLRGILIEGCTQMSTIVAGDTVDNAINNTPPENAGLLPNLEQLHLDNLQLLSIIFEGPLHPKSFALLHTLTLKNCPQLTSIFSMTAVDDFCELQKLEVQNCPLIKVLISAPEEGKSMLPKLKVLTLDDLPELKFICPNKNLAWRSLEQLKVQKCCNLKALPFNTSNAAKIITIEGKREWWDNLVWTPPEVLERFKSAFSAST